MSEWAVVTDWRVLSAHHEGPACWAAQMKETATDHGLPLLVRIENADHIVVDPAEYAAVREIADIVDLHLSTGVVWRVKNQDH